MTSDVTKPHTTAARLTFRMPEVAEQLGVGVSTVQRWVASGALTCIRPSAGVVLIRPADLEAFLDSHAEGGDAAPRSRRTTRKK